MKLISEKVHIHKICVNSCEVHEVEVELKAASCGKIMFTFIKKTDNLYDDES